MLIEQALAHAGRRQRLACEVRHISTLIGLVQQGLVVAVVAVVAMVRQLSLPSDRSRVVGVRLDHPEISRTIGRIQRAGRSLSPAAEAFAAMFMQASRAQAR